MEFRFMTFQEQREWKAALALLLLFATRVFFAAGLGIGDQKSDNFSKQQHAPSIGECLCEFGLWCSVWASCTDLEQIRINCNQCWNRAWGFSSESQWPLRGHRSPLSSVEKGRHRSAWRLLSSLCYQCILLVCSVSSWWESRQRKGADLDCAFCRHSTIDQLSQNHLMEH